MVFKKIGVILLAVLFTQVAFGQDTIWTKTYGETAGDYGRSVYPTNDGGYILAGYSSGFGATSQDFCVIKTDVDGETTWVRVYGGENVEEAHAIKQISDGNYVVAGETNSYGSGAYDFYLVKLDSQGDTIWTKTYGGTAIEYCNMVEETSDGGFILAGTTMSFGLSGYNCYLVRVTASGDTVWTNTYGGNGHDWFYDVKETPEGDFIAAGYYTPPGMMMPADCYIVKTDANGDTVWTKAYGSDIGEKGYGLCLTSDGGCLVVGQYGGGMGGPPVDAFLVRLDSNGDSLWTKLYGGGSADYAWSVDNTSDGGFIIAGQTRTFTTSQNNEDVWVLKTDANGDTLWTRAYGYDGVNQQDFAHSVKETADGGYIIAGATNSTAISAGNYDVYLLKFPGPAFNYLPGDANMYNAVWPPTVLGADATYLINYFRAYTTSIPCLLNNPLAPTPPGPYFWASADVNGDCNIIGADATKLVNYLRGQTTLSYCQDYPPAWLIPADLPVDPPPGWPNCLIR